MKYRLEYIVQWLKEIGGGTLREFPCREIIEKPTEEEAISDARKLIENIRVNGKVCANVRFMRIDQEEKTTEISLI